MWALAGIGVFGFAATVGSLVRIERAIQADTDQSVHALRRIESDVESIRNTRELISTEIRSAAENRLITRGQVGAVQDELAELNRAVRRAADGAAWQQAENC